MKRYAMIVIVEADSPQEAWESLDEHMRPPINEPHSSCVYIGDPCPTISADEYETEQIRLRADGESVCAAPEPEPWSLLGEIEEGWPEIAAELRANTPVHVVRERALATIDAGEYRRLLPLLNTLESAVRRGDFDN